jgi:hypothetical protein
MNRIVRYLFVMSIVMLACAQVSGQINQKASGVDAQGSVLGARQGNLMTATCPTCGRPLDEHKPAYPIRRS